MIFVISWDNFHTRYFLSNQIFVDEQDDKWIFHCYDGMALIKSHKDKSEDTAENIMFVERYLSGKENLIRVENIIDEEEIIEDEKEFEVNLEDGQI